MDELLQMGRTALAAQPFSRLLGAELIAFRPGEAELALTIRPDLLQQHGFVHGGVIGYLTDNALTFAGGSVLGPAVVTSEYKINYHIIERHSRSAFGRESRLSLRNIGSPIKAFGDDEKNPVSTIKRPLIIHS